LTAREQKGLVKRQSPVVVREERHLD